MKLSELFVFAVTAALGAQEVPEASAPERIVRGRVLDEIGAPLAGAGVFVGDRDQVLTVDALARPQVRSGADGRFEVCVPRGRRAEALLVAAPGRVTAFWPSFTSDSSSPFADGSAAVELGAVRLPNGVDLAGRVRGQDGQPIEHARIQCIDLMCPATVSQQTFGSCAESDAKGAFVLQGACPTAVQVVVDAPGHYRRTVPILNAGEPLVVVLQESGFVSGKLVDAEGRPAAGSVFVNYEISDHRFGRDHQRTVDGTFRVTLGYPCRYVLAGWVEGSHALAETGVLTGPQVGVVLRAAPPAARKHVVVTARDAATGTPIERFKAAIEWGAHADRSSARRSLRWSAQSADEHGVVRICGPRFGEEPSGVLVLVAEGHAPFFKEGITFDAAADQPIETPCVSAATVTGVIVDADSGAPLGGALVVAMEKDRFRRGDWDTVLSHARADAAGVFTLDGLGAGEFTVAARRPDDAAEVARPVKLDERQQLRDVRLALPAAVTVSGKVENLAASGAHIVRTRRRPRVSPPPAVPRQHRLGSVGRTRCRADRCGRYVPRRRSGIGELHGVVTAAGAGAQWTAPAPGAREGGSGKGS